MPGHAPIDLESVLACGTQPAGFTDRAAQIENR